MAHYLLGKSKNKKTAHSGVQTDTGSPGCRALCLCLHCRTHLSPELIPMKLSVNRVQEKGDICFEQQD